jgi:hypothetical protein
MDSHPLFRGFIEAALQNRKAMPETPRMKIVRT